MTQQFRLAWRADVSTSAKPLSTAIDDYAAQVRMLERSGVDFAVLGQSRRLGFNPGVIAGALAPRAGGIGLVPDLVTVDYPPYKLARLMATLDMVTGGRIGWQVRTRAAEAVPDEYAIADEYLDVCRKLWGSWAPDALVEDIETAVFADAAKVRPINHAGKYFTVTGPLNTIPLRGAPLLVHLPETAEDCEFSGRHADVAILGRGTVEAVTGARDAVRAGAEKTGREPDAVQVLCAVAIHVDEAAPGVTVSGKSADRLSLHGPSAGIAARLETLVRETGTDGVLVHGDWDPVRTTQICTQVFGTLRRRGLIRAQDAAVTGLRERVLA